MKLPHPKKATVQSIAVTALTIGGVGAMGIMAEVLHEICTVIVAHQLMSLTGKLLTYFGLIHTHDNEA